MELAALASFAILLVAWIFAPDRPRAAAAAKTGMLDPEPLAA